jgi:sugar lactone lactonase YvrE
MKSSLCLLLAISSLLSLTLPAQTTSNEDRIRVTNRAGGGPGGSVTGFTSNGARLEDLLFPLNKIENEFIIGPNGMGSSDVIPDLYVTTADNKLVRITPAGVPTVVTTTGTSLNFPHNVAIDRAGNIYIANFGNGTVTKTTVTQTGQTQTYSTAVLASGLSGPIGLAFDRAGNLYVTNSRNNTITRITPAGVSSLFYSGSALSQPWGLAFDVAGDLYVANSGNNTITRITPGGAATPVITGGLNSPRGLAFDSQGNLYVTNSGNNTLARIPPGGVATVLSSSSLNEPTSIAITDKDNKPLSLPPSPVPQPPLPPVEPGRITNMSIRSTAGTGAQTLIVGAVVAGAGTSGTKPLLIRGIGPALTGFGVPGVLADPLLSVFAGTNVVAANDNWGGDAQVIAIGNAVAAFGLAPATSRDAALYAPALPARDYTIQITGAGGTTGVALAEIYDATPAGSFTATTPQLVNVSARTQVGTGADILIAGFTLGGATARTVLIRAVGPTLTGFGVPGALADPQLALFTGAMQLQQNNDWGAAANAAQITSTTTALATFQLGTGSRDSAILTTLQPGSYTAQISGVGGTTGVALVEIYVVP